MRPEERSKSLLNDRTAIRHGAHRRKNPSATSSGSEAPPLVVVQDPTLAEEAILAKEEPAPPAQAVNAPVPPLVLVDEKPVPMATIIAFWPGMKVADVMCPSCSASNWDARPSERKQCENCEMLFECPQPTAAVTVGMVA